MSKKKMARRALYTSMISLILCCAMLMGTTFAWFTDSVSSAKNLIQAGNLDVELYYMNDETSDWTVVDANTNIFKEATLWEPGHTEVVKLKVSNLGSLALKYQLGINIASETESVNMAGNSFKVSDYIYFGVIEGDQTYTREEAVAAVEGTAKKLNAGYTEPSELKKQNDSEIVTVVVYMPTTVTNEANHGYNQTPPQINLGITLAATQLVNENDSFGPDYDDDATYADVTYIIDADKPFADAIADINNAEDETVLLQLTEDISWETGAGIGSTPLVGEDGKVQDLIIDAKGQTFTATGDGVGSIRMANGGTLTIKNATIKDESESYAENSWEYGYLEFAGNVVFKNVTFENAIMFEGESATFINCSFNSHAENEYAVWVSDGTATFTGCTFTGARGLKTHEAYGSEVDTIVVDNCTFKDLTKKPGVAIGTMNADTAITIKNSKFINCQAGDQGLYIYETDTDVNSFNFDCSQNNQIIKSEKVSTTDEFIAAIENGANQINLAPGEYSVHFTNNTAFNVDGMTITGQEGVKLSVSSSEVWYGRIQGSNVTFEDITFTGTVGATGEATYNNCTFEGQLECASSGGAKTYVNNCTVNTLHTSVDMNAGNVYVEDSTITKAEYSGAVTMTFEDCSIGELIPWNTNTVLNNCTVTTLNAENMTTATLIIDGEHYAANADMLASAANAGASVVNLADGEYNVYGCAGKTLTINGSKNAVLKVYNEGEDGCDAGFDSANVTFNGITIDTTANTGNYKGYTRLSATFNDCNFFGAYTSHRVQTFNNCYFDFNNGYFWIWGAEEVNFNGCEFGGNSKAILAHGWASSKINIKDCKFAATEKGYASGGTVWTAAVEIDPAGTNTYTINFTGNNTINENYAGWTRVKDDSTGHTITGLE